MYLVAFLLMLFALTIVDARAQNDPRLPTEAIKYLQNELTFLGARVNILQQDMEVQRKRLCDLISEDKRPEECKK